MLPDQSAASISSVVMSTPGGPVRPPVRPLGGGCFLPASNSNGCHPASRYSRGISLFMSVSSHGGTGTQWRDNVALPVQVVGSCGPGSPATGAGPTSCLRTGWRSAVYPGRVHRRCLDHGSRPACSRSLRILSMRPACVSGSTVMTLASTCALQPADPRPVSRRAAAQRSRSVSIGPEGNCRRPRSYPWTVQKDRSMAVGDGLLGSGPARSRAAEVGRGNGSLAQRAWRPP